MAEPTITETRIFYPIKGHSGEELYEQMNIHGPGKQFHASTRWYVTWHYGYQQNKQSCQLTQLNVDLHIVYEYPYWLNYQTSNKNLQKKWEQSFHHLEIHEKGHGKNGVKAAKAIENALLHLPVHSECHSLKTTINHTANDLIEKHLQEDFEYDFKTQHGQKS